MSEEKAKIVLPSIKKEKFLEAYAVLGNLSSAAKAANCNRQNHYDWIKEDPGYLVRFEAAKEEAADRAEQELVRRAIQGVDEPVFGTVYGDNGKPTGKDVVGHVRRYSDVLLIFWLKALRPDKYRERFEYSGKVDGPAINLFQMIVQAQAQPVQIIEADGTVGQWGGAQPLLRGPGGNGKSSGEPGGNGELAEQDGESP